MKKIILTTISILGISLFFSGVVFAQGIMGDTVTSSDGHTAREEAEGKIVWEKLQAKQVQCSDLSDDDFGVLGEYFMGQMTGASHEAINVMMEQMMGKKGEEQMHVVMGKRLSGCDASAAFPSQDAGFMPMMQMMWGGWSSPFGSNQSNNSMMNFGFMPFGGFGWIFMLVFWGLIIWVIVSLVRGGFGRGHMCGHDHGDSSHEKSPLEILKERYAKGEIDKKEFEERKKDLI